MIPGKTYRNLVWTKRAALLVILGIGLFIRFYKLGENPVGFYRDEASTGYDAFSIMQTGRDQYGTILPLFARSFGDYDESLYRFLVVPSVLLFGLNEFAVRLPAALIGLLTILVFYFLARAFVEEKIALIITFLLAVSPWHIMYSRVGFRAVLFPFFLCLGLFFFLEGLKRKKILVAAAIAFAFSLYTYSAARVFVPLFLVFLAALFFKDLKKHKKQAVIAGIILSVVLAALALFWVSPAGMARAREALQPNRELWLANYLSYFSPNFLFFNKNPGLEYYVLGVGQLYVVEIFTIVAGLVGLLATFFKTGNKKFLVIIGGLLLYPLPAAMTQSSHALRAIIGCIFFPLLSGCGIEWLLDFLKNKALKIAVAAGLVFTIFAGFLNFQGKYFHEYPYYSWYYWDYGWKQAIALTKRKHYDNIFVSDRFFLPHAFILFYTQYPPGKYQKIAPKSLTMENLAITDFSLPPYHIVSLNNLYPAMCRNAAILTYPEQKKIIEQRLPLKEVGVVKTPDKKRVSMILLELREPPPI